MTLADYLRVLRKKWYVIVACAALGIVGGAIVSAVVPPTYTAHATLYFSTVAPGPASSSVSAYEAALLAQQQVKSISLLANTERVAQEVIDDLRLDTAPDDLLPSISATSDPETVILVVNAEHPSPQLAADIANSTGRALIRLTDKINSDAAAASLPTILPTVRAEIVQPAAVPVSASAGTRTANLLGGLVAGLLVGLAAVLLRKLLDGVVRIEADLTTISAAPALGSTPFAQDVGNRPLTVVDEPDSELAASYRQLRVNLGAAMGQSHVVAVVSAGRGEGRTSTVCNLALAFAESGCRVAVLDADLRNPRIGDYLGFDSMPGLAEVLAGSHEVSQVLRSWPRPGPHPKPAGQLDQVDLVLAGRERRSPGRLLASHRLHVVLEELKQQHQVVLVDCPPSSTASDVSYIAAHVDALLVLGRHGHTRLAAVRRMVDELGLAGGRVIGNVLTLEKTRWKLGIRPSKRSAPAPSSPTVRTADVRYPRGRTLRNADASDPTVRLSTTSTSDRYAPQVRPPTVLHRNNGPSPREHESTGS